MSIKTTGMRSEDAEMRRLDKRRRRQYLYCGLLMGMLAACSYFGAGRENEIRMVSLPVTRTEIKQAETAYDSFAEAGMSGVRARLDARRGEEIALLDEAIASADAQTIRYASAQKAEIAARMETEALAYAALEAMGSTDCAVCSGAGVLTVFLPGVESDSSEQTASLLDALSQQTGMPADSVKIILVKNET